MTAPPTSPGIEMRSFFAGFTSFDWLLSALLLWSTVRGLLHGLIRELFSMAAVIAGLLVAAWNYRTLADYLAPWLSRWMTSLPSREIFAFLLLLTGVSVSVLLLGRLLRSAVRMVGLGPLDRLAGAFFGLVRAVLVDAAVLLGSIAFLPPMAPVRDSRLAPYLVHVVYAVSFSLPASFQERFAIGLVRP